MVDRGTRRSIGHALARSLAAGRGCSTAPSNNLINVPISSTLRRYRGRGLQECHIRRRGVKMGPRVWGVWDGVRGGWVNRWRHNNFVNARLCSSPLPNRTILYRVCNQRMCSTLYLLEYGRKPFGTRCMSRRASRIYTIDQKFRRIAVTWYDF